MHSCLGHTEEGIFASVEEMGNDLFQEMQLSFEEAYHRDGGETLLDDEEESQHDDVEESQAVVSVTHLYERWGISSVVRAEAFGEGKLKAKVMISCEYNWK